jgi:tetratricopeptide (TPR) repeat protein
MGNAWNGKMDRGRILKFVGLSVVVGLAATIAYQIFRPEDEDKTRAEQAASRRQFSVASEHWDRYLERNPDDDEAHLAAARASRLRDDFTAAISQLRRSTPSAAVKLEYQLIEAQQGDPQQIQTLFSRYSDNSENAHTALVMEAIAIGALRVLNPQPGTNSIVKVEQTPLLPMGLHAVNRWLELRPGREDQAAGYTWRARLQDMAADHESAMADFRKALELDPDSYETQLYWAFSSRLESAPKETLTLLLQLQKLRPDDHNVTLGLVGTYRLLGRLEDARRQLDELLGRLPNQASLLVERGNLAIDESKPDEAERFLDRARNLEPNRADVYFALSRCMSLTGRLDKMREYQSRFLELEDEQKRNRPHN